MKQMVFNLASEIASWLIGERWWSPGWQVMGIYFCDSQIFKKFQGSNLNLNLNEDIEVLRGGATCPSDLFLELGAVL